MAVFETVGATIGRTPLVFAQQRGSRAFGARCGQDGVAQSGRLGEGPDRPRNDRRCREQRDCHARGDNAHRARPPATPASRSPCWRGTRLPCCADDAREHVGRATQAACSVWRGDCAHPGGSRHARRGRRGRSIDPGSGRVPSPPGSSTTPRTLPPTTPPRAPRSMDDFSGLTIGAFVAGVGTGARSPVWDGF